MEPKVGIVLVNYNGEKFQNECISSIKKMEYKNYIIIIVDNNSTDKSIKIAIEKFDDLIIIKNKENCGVAEGNNIGIKKALELNCEYILLLNNDTEVDKYMLSNMIKNANSKTLVTCKMYYYPKNILWFAGGRIDWGKATTIHEGINEVDLGQYDNPKYIEYCPTCCLLINKDVFEDVGLMDEKYFMYFDDTDFIVRVNRKGYKILYEPSAKLWHKVSSSSGGEKSKLYIYYINRNRLYFIKKNCKKKILPKTYFYATRLILYLKYKINKNDRELAIKKAIYDFKNNKMYRADLDNL